jgi:LytS/YehU family sensor histidine kinase
LNSTNSSILYLDDEVDNLIAFKAVFRRSYDVHTAANTEEAWNVLKNTAIQIIISDQRMPEVSGVDFLSSVSLEYPEIIRMILTGYSDMQSIIDAINKGKIYYYITKPWKFEELKIIIDKGIEAYNLRVQNILLLEENTKLLLKTKEQENIQLTSQLEILKNQINPHFLFNCLNTLASLIATSPDLAVNFTTKFSKLYRSTLDHGNNRLVQIDREIEFATNYFLLQKIRFGNNLTLTLKDKHDCSRFILPFALQLLIENAIKHNEISATNPLEICITQYDDFLNVTNKICKKRSIEISSGIGLKNLSDRSKLIVGQDIVIFNDGLTFDVTIPISIEQ